MEIALEGTWHFKVLMQIASFVNEDTPSSDKLKILRMFMEKFSYGAEDGYEEQFKRCLDGIPVSEVIEMQLCFLSFHGNIPLLSYNINGDHP